MRSSYLEAQAKARKTGSFATRSRVGAFQPQVARLELQELLESSKEKDGDTETKAS